MKTREEEIAEMAKEMRNYGYKHLCAGRVFYYGFCEKLYDAGYRKQSDTVREFVGKISAVALQMRCEASRAYQQGRSLSKAQFAFGEENAIENLMEQINEFAKEYGVEVEE